MCAALGLSRRKGHGYSTGAVKAQRSWIQHWGCFGAKAMYAALGLLRRKGCVFSTGAVKAQRLCVQHWGC